MSYFRCLQQIKAQFEMVTNVKIFTGPLHTLFKLNALFMYFLVSKKNITYRRSVVYTSIINLSSSKLIRLDLNIKPLKEFRGLTSGGGGTVG